MVTKIHAKANNAKATSNTADDLKRCKELNAVACKASHESFVAISAAFAASVFFAVVHGRTDPLNDLFDGLHDKDREAMRIFAMPEMGVQFDAGAKRISVDGKERWLERPVAIFAYKAKPDTSKAERHWTLVNLGENTSLVGNALERAKAMKAAIRKAGEDSLKYQWVRPEIAGTVGEPLSEETARKSMLNTLLKIAKGAATAGITHQTLVATARTFGLSVEQIGKITDAYTPAKPNANENEPNETDADNGERKAEAA